MVKKWYHISKVVTIEELCLTPMLPMKAPSWSLRVTPPGKVMRPPLECSNPYTCIKPLLMFHFSFTTGLPSTQFYLCTGHPPAAPAVFSCPGPRTPS